MASKEIIKLKASILVEGISAEVDCLQGLGRDFKEQNHGLFGWDFEDHPGSFLPDDFCLPDGTVIQFRFNSNSPYRVKMRGSKMFLCRIDEEICPVTWIKRPAFYDKSTSYGEKMNKTGQVGGEDCLFFCYQNYCSYFSKKSECLFCNLVPTSKTYNSVLEKKDVDSIGEVAKEAWAEGMVNHVLLTGGCTSQKKELEMVSGIIDSLKSYTGMDRVPGTILPSPARGDFIKRYHDTGIGAIGYSMEIWDEKLYKAICPGKAKGFSHDEFVQSIAEAVKVFGEGNVYGVFVLGLEPKETFLEGVRTLTGVGANVVPFVWSPNPGSKLEGHRAPTPEWYLDVTMEAAEIVEKSGVRLAEENHCYRCDGNSLLHDALRQF